MIHVAVPAALVAVLAGCGVYGMLARRNAVMVLIGAEVLLAAGGLLLVLGSVVAPDDLATGQVATIMLITIAAAEIGLALALVLLLFRVRATSDLSAVRELGESSPTYSDYVDPTTDPAGTEVAR